MKLLEKSSRNDNFKRLIISDKTTYDWTYVILLPFSQSNMLNLSCQKRKRYKMKLMKNEWRFTRHMNALKQQSSLNRWHVFRSERAKLKWNAEIDRRRRIQTGENKNRYIFLNFALNYYHYHCCCSNERFFKSETLFLHRLKVY